MKVMMIGLILSVFLISGCFEEMSLGEARMIAENSECLDEGPLSPRINWNSDTKTFWIDMDTEKEGCAPACVVDVETETASINWRCAGLI